MGSGATVSISKAALFLFNLLTGEELVPGDIVTVQRQGRNDPQGLRVGFSLLPFLWRPDESYLFH
jgi:hypothetical protein